MGEHIGLFQSMEKLALRLVARGSNGKLDASLSVHLFRLDADHVHSDRQNLLEIHKHVGPIKAFRSSAREMVTPFKLDTTSSQAVLRVHGRPSVGRVRELARF